MAAWPPCTITPSRLRRLVERRLLAPQEVSGWRIPEDPLVPAPEEDEVVTFAAFHERGLGLPAHPFLRGLLHFYNLELHHLNPNGFLHIAVFVAFCEGFLGIEAHFALRRHFFTVRVLTEKGSKAVLPVGGAAIQLRSGRGAEYISVRLPSSNRGWHGDWFYVKNQPN